MSPAAPSPNSSSIGGAGTGVGGLPDDPPDELALEAELALDDDEALDPEDDQPPDVLQPLDDALDPLEDALDALDPEEP